MLVSTKQNHHKIVHSTCDVSQSTQICPPPNQQPTSLSELCNSRDNMHDTGVKSAPTTMNLSNSDPNTSDTPTESTSTGSSCNPQPVGDDQQSNNTSSSASHAHSYNSSSHPASTAGDSTLNSFFDSNGNELNNQIFDGNSSPSTCEDPGRDNEDNRDDSNHCVLSGIAAVSIDHVSTSALRSLITNIPMHSIVIFDIDETVLLPSCDVASFFSRDNISNANGKIKEIQSLLTENTYIHQSNLNHNYHIATLQVKCVEPHTAEIIFYLQHVKRCLVFALTARSSRYADVTTKQLLSCNIDFTLACPTEMVIEASWPLQPLFPRSKFHYKTTSTPQDSSSALFTWKNGIVYCDGLSKGEILATLIEMRIFQSEPRVLTPFEHNRAIRYLGLLMYQAMLSQVRISQACQTLRTVYSDIFTIDSSIYIHLSPVKDPFLPLLPPTSLATKNACCTLGQRVYWWIRQYTRRNLIKFIKLIVTPMISNHHHRRRCGGILKSTSSPPQSPSFLHLGHRTAQLIALIHKLVTVIEFTESTSCDAITPDEKIPLTHHHTDECDCLLTPYVGNGSFQLVPPLDKLSSPYRTANDIARFPTPTHDIEYDIDTCETISRPYTHMFPPISPDDRATFNPYRFIVPHACSPSSSSNRRHHAQKKDRDNVKTRHIPPAMRAIVKDIDDHATMKPNGELYLRGVREQATTTCNCHIHHELCTPCEYASNECIFNAAINTQDHQASIRKHALPRYLPASLITPWDFTTQGNHGLVICPVVPETCQVTLPVYHEYLAHQQLGKTCGYGCFPLSSSHHQHQHEHPYDHNIHQYSLVSHLFHLVEIQTIDANVAFYFKHIVPRNPPVQYSTKTLALPAVFTLQTPQVWFIDNTKCVVDEQIQYWSSFYQYHKRQSLPFSMRPNTHHGVLTPSTQFPMSQSPTLHNRQLRCSQTPDGRTQQQDLFQLMLRDSHTPLTHGMISRTHLDLKFCHYTFVHYGGAHQRPELYDVCALDIPSENCQEAMPVSRLPRCIRPKLMLSWSGSMDPEFFVTIDDVLMVQAFYFVFYNHIVSDYAVYNALITLKDYPDQQTSDCRSSRLINDSVLSWSPLAKLLLLNREQFHERNRLGDHKLQSIIGLPSTATLVVELVDKTKPSSSSSRSISRPNIQYILPYGRGRGASPAARPGVDQQGTASRNPYHSPSCSPSRSSRSTTEMDPPLVASTVSADSSNSTCTTTQAPGLCTTE